MKEYILCSAIWFDDNQEHPHQPKNIDSGYVVTGRRHHNCFTTLAILTKRNRDYLQFEKVQGFLTNTDRFVDRVEAVEIAHTAGQIDEFKKKLFSEDLW